MDRTVVLGRSDPDDAVLVAKDNIDGIIITTYSFTFTETYAEIPDDLLKKIADYYGVSVGDLTDDDIVNYLYDVLKIDKRVSDLIHNV